MSRRGLWQDDQLDAGIRDRARADAMTLLEAIVILEDAERFLAAEPRAAMAMRVPLTNGDKDEKHGRRR